MNFSVLLSLYYKENPNYLRESLDSIFTQTVLPNEIIMVKDGPLTEELDQTVLEYEKKYSFFKVIPLEQNQGLGKALNIGLDACTNDIVARMDTDDIAKSDRFEKQLKQFENHPELDVVGAWIEEFEGNIANVSSIRKVPQEHKDIYKYAQKRNPVNHPVVMFRKTAVLKAGGYQHFPLFEDYFLWVRMLMNGAKFHNIQEGLLYFRFTPDMFQRRGGWQYALTEIKLMKLYYKMGFINALTFLQNVVLRFAARVIPNNLRGYLYKKLAR